MTNQEVSVPTTTAIDRMEQFHAYMYRRAHSEGANTKDVAQAISARNQDQIFAAETEDDIWDAGSGGTIQGRDAVGLELEFYDYRPVISSRTFEGEDADTAKGYYITANASILGGPADVLRRLGLEIGDEIAFQTGADDVIFRLRAFELRGILDPEQKKTVKGLVKGIETSSGNTVVKLARLPVRAVPSTAVK